MAPTLAAIATGLAATFLVPQLLRLLRRRDASGVSTVWAAFGVVTNLAWVLYLAAAGQWIATVAPALAVVSYGAVLALVARLDGRPHWIGGTVVYAAAFCLIGVTGGLTAVAVLLAATPAIQLAPEILAVYRKARPTGVAPATWAMALGEALCWGAYGLIVVDRALIGYGVLTSVGSLLVLGRWWVRCGPRRLVPLVPVQRLVGPQRQRAVPDPIGG